MRKAKNYKKMEFLFHKGILKISLKGFWIASFKIGSSGHTSFKRKNKSVLVERTI